MFNEQLVVTFDTDGVLANSQKPIVDRFNGEFGKFLTVDDWTEFDLLTKMAMQLSGESAVVVAGWLYATEVMMEAVPYPESQRVIRELIDAGIQLSVCTSRPAEQAMMTYEWIKQFFPEIQNVFVRNGDTPGLRGNEFKLQTAQLRRANVVVDDDTAMLSTLVTSLQQGTFPTLRQPIIVDRPWNDREQFPSPVLRVGNWKQNDFGWQAIKTALLGSAH